MDPLISDLQESLGNGGTVVFTALRVAAVFAALLLFFRISGKRVLGQFTRFDLVTLLLISNAVQNAMIGPDNSLSGGLIAAGILLILNRLVSTHPRLREAIEMLRTRPLHSGRKRCFTEDEGRSLEVGLQEQASNRLKLRGLRAFVVSVEGKGGARLRQVRIEETNASEPLSHHQASAGGKHLGDLS